MQNAEKKINNNQKSESKSQNNTRKETPMAMNKNENQSHSKFCGKCGKKLKNQSESESKTILATLMKL